RPDARRADVRPVCRPGARRPGDVSRMVRRMTARIATIDRDSVAADSARYYAAQPGTPAHSAEVLRAELFALREASRRALVDRTLGLLAAGPLPDPDDLLELLRRLEWIGDVTSGPAGRVAASPLRAVRLADGHYLL